MNRWWRRFGRTLQRRLPHRPAARSPALPDGPDAIDRLFAAVQAARYADPASSRTAKLIRDGVVKMAKKVAEEAVEVGLDAVQGDRRRVVQESADLIYNLAVLWSETGIAPGDVWAEMERRERMQGIAEKLPKQGARN